VRALIEVVSLLAGVATLDDDLDVARLCGLPP